MPRALTSSAWLRIVERQLDTIESLQNTVAALVAFPGRATEGVPNKADVAASADAGDVPPSLPSPVGEVVARMAGRDAAMTDYLQHLAQDMIDEGMDPGLVAQTIAQGVLE